MRRRYPLSYHAVLVTALCALAAAMVGTRARADLTPPADPNEVWYIYEDETVEYSDADVTIPNPIVLTGHMTLTNCTLRLGRQLDVRYAATATNTGVTATNTWFTAAPGTTGATVGGSGGVNTFTDCTFDPVEVSFGAYSKNAFENCVLRRSTPIGGGVYGYSQNTFTGCVFDGGYGFTAPSNSVVEACSFVGPSAWQARATLWARGGVDVRVSGFRPGDDVTNAVRYEDGTAMLDLIGTSIGGIQLDTRDTSVISVNQSTLLGVVCHDQSQTELVDSHIGELWVHMYAGGSGGPVNVTVTGLRADGTPQDTTISSDNSPFTVALSNTDISYRAYLSFGDNGGPGGSVNRIEDSLVWWVEVIENSSLHMVGTTVEGHCIAGMPSASTSTRLVTEDSVIQHLWVGGDDTEALLRRSTVCSALNLRARDPGLVFESGALGDPLAIAVIHPDVYSARISGALDVGPSVYVRQWESGSTVIRSFPVFVKRPDGQPVAGAAVEVAHPPDPCIWSGVTDADGFAYPEVTFDDTNHGTELTVTAEQGGATDSARLTFLSSTPIELVLPVVYQIQWVPPLHDGTTAEAPDGPFKCGRTIPVKFRLLDAEGQPIPDEQAEALTATLQVFYEAPCDQGIPTDPGDAEPDTGSEFRYVADDDLFIYNLSTKDSAWLADYTYGLEVLIDGTPVGEVYFSLR